MKKHVYPSYKPRAFLEYRLRSLRGNALSVTLTASIPGDICNDYDIGGEFLRVNESSELPEFPTFVGDVIIESTNLPCPVSPPVVVNIHRIFTFEPTAGEDDHLILLVPSEFSVRVRDAFGLDVEENIDR